VQDKVIVTTDVINRKWCMAHRISDDLQ